MRKKQNPHDIELWERIKKGIRPLKTKNEPLIETETVDNSIKSIDLISKPMLINSPQTHLNQKNDRKLELTGLTRRTAQKLTRGQLAFEARIDLHGHNLENARQELKRFLIWCQQSELSIVLVITGKGESSFARHTLHGRNIEITPDRRGKIRRNLIDWFDELEFRSYITGYLPAHPRHGGGGAFYVKIRRQKN